MKMVVSIRGKHSFINTPVSHIHQCHSFCKLDVDGAGMGLLLAPNWREWASCSSPQVKLTQQILCVILRSLSQGGSEDPQPPTGHSRPGGIPHHFWVWGVGSTMSNSKGFYPEVMKALNKWVLSGEQVSSQCASHSFWKPVVLSPLWDVGGVHVGTQVWSFKPELEVARRRRSIFMSGFLRFYFIFLTSTYAFWCPRPHDFAFISD